MKKKIVSVFLVLVLLIMILSGCKNANESTEKKSEEVREYQTVIDKCFEGLNNCDAAAYVSTFPDFEEKDEAYTKTVLEDRKIRLENTYGKNIINSYEILFDKEFNEEQLQNIEQRIKEGYDVEIDIVKGYKVKVREKIIGDDDFDEATNYMYLYKFNDNWYMVDMSPNV